MKYEARIFDMASQSIFCRITVISYWIVLFTKLVCIPDGNTVFK